MANGEVGEDGDDYDFPSSERDDNGGDDASDAHVISDGKPARNKKNNHNLAINRAILDQAIRKQRYDPDRRRE